MPHNPTTFAGEPGDENAIAWDDPAVLHRRGDTGMLHEFRVARHGTMAQLVHEVVAMPDDMRVQYMIERLGDREYEPHEIKALANRPDFPL
jgi:hypothetical protein